MLRWGAICFHSYSMECHFCLHSFSPILLLSFGLISWVLPAVAVVENKNTSTDPRLALLSFKSLLSDPLGSLASWDSKGTLHYCLWRGVACGRRHPLQVVTLELDSLGLVGPISPIISNLTYLRVIQLQDNQLHGRIPEELGRLARLRCLNLSMNSFQGEIPAALSSHCSHLQTINLGNNRLSGEIPPNLTRCFNLQFLRLSHNMLVGQIPPDIGSLSMLHTLRLGYNNLTGGIPPSLGNLSSLQWLYLIQNNLEGRIPERVGNIHSLQELILSFNNLTDQIPSSLYNLSAITDLEVEYNRLSGTLPRDMGLALPNLQTLVMQGNQLEGPIPTSMSNASALELLDIANNSFTGDVPSNLGSLSNLRELNAAFNHLQAHDWSFLSSLTNCSLLEKLYLYENQLEGALPSSVGDLSTRLERLAIGYNQISGTIPVEIGNLVSLTALRMPHNHFVGSIPAAVGKLQHLNVLDLSRNNLSGPIPSAIGNLDRLSILYMQENKLSGVIPASIGGCKSLGILNLSHNALGGTIPRELASLSSLTQCLDLSHNSLVGSIPVEVGSLINLGCLYVSGNQLSGDIPSTLGACLVLERVHMEGNFFQGIIPRSFIDLRGLEELDLSRNNLSGRIPDFLGSFGSLRSLNLSFNDFEGEVPSGGVFINGSEISVIGNKKLCGGSSNLGLPSCSAHAPERRINPLQVIIPVVSAVIFLVLFLVVILRNRQRKTDIIGSLASSFDGDQRYMKISYADIYKATDGFSSANLAGVGSFGSVYEGKIDSEENIVAVKVFNLYQKGALRSFTAECEALRNVRHKNLVKIITACSSVDSRGNDFKALIFKYMTNGRLEKWLHPGVSLEHPQPASKLTLIQRLKIAIDVASALDYLHHSCQPTMVHCDLKPSNILLDNDMTAHVADFGLARFLTRSISAAAKNSISSIGIKGSIGYIAPEYGLGDQVSTQGDVYSFGILLLEMMTGKKPTDDLFEDGLNLRRYVEMAFPECIMKILDPQLVSRDEGEATMNNFMNESIIIERSTRCISSLLRIGLLCSNDNPRERMQMRDVTTEIHTIKELFLMVNS